MIFRGGEFSTGEMGNFHSALTPQDVVIAENQQCSVVWTRHQALALPSVLK